jgi:hypothetical protein
MRRAIACLFLLCTTARADIHSDLAGNWACQDNAASTVVVGTVGGNGTLQGGDNTADIDTTGPNATYPSALLFNGTDDWVSVTANQIQTSGSPCTIAWWMDRVSTNARVPITMGSSNVSFDRHIYLQDATTINVKLGSDKNWTITALGTDWHHIAITADGSEDVRLYIDGVEEDTEQNDATIDNLWFQGFGARGTPDLFFDGAIAGVRIYTRALSDADITELFEWDGSLPEVGSNTQVIIVH